MTTYSYETPTPTAPKSILKKSFGEKISDGVDHIATSISTALHVSKTIVMAGMVILVIWLIVMVFSSSNDPGSLNAQKHAANYPKRPDRTRNLSHFSNPPSATCTAGEAQACDLDWSGDNVDFATKKCGDDGKWIRTGLKGDEYCIVQCKNSYGNPCPRNGDCVVGRCGECENDGDCSDDYKCETKTKVCIPKKPRDMSCKTNADCDATPDITGTGRTNGVCENGQCVCGRNPADALSALGMPNENAFWEPTPDGKHKCGQCVDGMGVIGKPVPPGMFTGTNIGDPQMNTCILPLFTDPLQFQVCGAGSAAGDQACNSAVPTSYEYSRSGTTAGNFKCQIDEYYGPTQMQPNAYNYYVSDIDQTNGCMNFTPSSSTHYGRPIMPAV